MDNSRCVNKGRRAAWVTRFALVLVIAAMMASCTTKAVKRQEQLNKSYDEGNYLATIEHIQKNQKELYGENAAFLYNMDIGILYHYSAMYDSSNVYLQKALDIYDELFTRSVTNEAAAIMTNDNARPYRARPYELVFLHQIAALNFMARGDFEAALVESRRVQLHFNEWERTRAKDKKYHTDGMSHLFTSLAYERMNEDDNSLISLYKSVDAYNKGPVSLPPEVKGFAHDRLTAGDRENDVMTLGVAPYDGENKWSAKMREPEIIVVGYAGKGPYIADVSWSGTYAHAGVLMLTSSEKGPNGKFDVLTLPAPAASVPSGSTFSIKVSLPKYRPTQSRTGHFTARVGGKSYKSVVVGDLDKQLEKALDDAWTEIVTRTVIRVVVRTAAAQTAKNRTELGNPLLNLAKNIAVDVGSAQMERADTRSCFMIPKRVHMVRIPVEPGDHTVELTVHDNGGAVIGRTEFKDVKVGRGEKKVLMHNSLR